MTADAPVCAEWMCETPVRWRVDLEVNGQPDEPLAYACKPVHLTTVMRATRHLGTRRIIREVKP